MNTKKVLKVIAIVLLVVAMMFVATQPVFADANSIIDDMQAGGNTSDLGGADVIFQKVINILWVVSIIVTIIVIMVIGLKYIIGSTQEKAEYKKSMIPLLVGTLLIVFATTIVKFLFGTNG